MDESTRNHNPETIPAAPDYADLIGHILATPTRWEPLPESWRVGVTRTAALWYLGGDADPEGDPVTVLALAWTHPTARPVILRTLPDFTSRRETDALERLLLTRYAGMRRTYPYLPPVDDAGYAATATPDDLSLLPEPLTGDAWNATAPPREWLAREWLPAGELCLLTGPGSVGKSLLLLQLAAALACDRADLNGPLEWLPRATPRTPTAPALTPDPVPVVLCGWEDTGAEMIRRRARLAGPGGCPWAGSVSINGRLHSLPMRDAEHGGGPLWAPAGNAHIETLGQLTPTGAAVRQYCEQHGARLLVVDTVADALTVNENNRALVSAALQSWASWAARVSCTVLLNAHPAKATDGEGADYSGSTAWRGKARILWTLRHPLDADPDELAALMGDPTRPERTARLTLNKNNYGFDGIHLDLVTVGERAGWQIVEPLTAAPTPGRGGRGSGHNGAAADTDFPFGANATRGDL